MITAKPALFDVETAVPPTSGKKTVMIRGRAVLSSLSAQLAKRSHQPAPQDLLCLQVFETGWTATVWPEDGGPPNTSTESFAASDAPLSAVDVLRQAVRSISASQRARIDRVRLTIDDRSLCLVDNRFLRLKSTDPVAVRQAGAQQLGTKGAVYGWHPFGASSEHEMQRGVYAFVSAERLQDYLVAMDSLAVKLVEIVPAWLLRLMNAGQKPFAALDMGAEVCTLVLADPDSGTFAYRQFPIGLRSMAEAIAAASSVSLREAMEGMARRVCIRLPGALGDPLTTTDTALAGLLASLKTELVASIDYFVFQRLAGLPERLILNGQAITVRGLAEWLASVMDLDVVPAGEPALTTPASETPSNLLENTPQQLLQIGRNSYEFVGGCFRLNRPQATRPTAKRRAGFTGIVTTPISFLNVSELLSGIVHSLNPMVVPAVYGSLVVALLGWTLLSFNTGNTAAAAGLLSNRLASSEALRREMRRHDHPIVPPPAALPWTDTLLPLARLLPIGIQLTNVTALSDPAKPQLDDRVLIEGRLLASDDYVAKVTDLVDRLAADPTFMRSVASIGLSGLAVTHVEGGDVGTFTISLVRAPMIAGSTVKSQ